MTLNTTISRVILSNVKLNRISFSRMTLIRISFSRMALFGISLSWMQFSKKTINRMTLSWMTPDKMTLSSLTLNRMTSCRTIVHNMCCSANYYSTECYLVFIHYLQPWLRQVKVVHLQLQNLVVFCLPSSIFQGSGDGITKVYFCRKSVFPMAF
jgi:hypothetical protein